MPHPKVDREDFLAWKAHPMTQWVEAHLRDLAAAEASRCQAQLWEASSQRDSPDQTWASLQPETAFARGQCDTLLFVADLELEHLQPPEPKEAPVRPGKSTGYD